MALDDAPIVEVLKFDEDEAYNPDRTISGLIRTQLLHLHHAENLVVPPQFRTNININHLLTERQAGEYIHKVTILLHRFSESATKAKSKPKRKTSAKNTDGMPKAKRSRAKPKPR